MSFDAGSIVGTLDVTRTPFQAGLKAARKEAERFERTPVTVPLELNLRPARATLAAYRKQVVASSPVRLRVDANLTPARTTVAAYRKTVAAQSPARLAVDANLTAARASVAAYRRQVSQGRPARLPVGANVVQARRDVAGLRREVTSRGASVRVGADTGVARTQLAAVGAQASALNGRNPRVSVHVDTSQAVRNLGLITAAVAGLSATVAPAVASLAAIPVVLGGIGQGVAALFAGFSGVGDAVSAMDAASAAGAKAASGVGAAADASRAAVEGLADAQRQQARTAAQGEEQVQTALRARRDAYTQVARQVADAGRAVEDAEAGVARAQRDARAAQLDLNQARDDARRRLRDYRLELSGAALDERGAVNALTRARGELARTKADFDLGKVTALDLSDAVLGVDEAAQSLAEVRQRNADLRREATAAARAGVAGDAQVVAARQRVVDANTGVRDAVRTVADAERDLRYAQVDGARQIADANRGVVAAQRQAAQANADAARQVVRAHQQMARAATSGAGAGGAAVDTLAQKMGKLSPAGRAFATFLHDEFLPNMRQIGASVQTAMLPKMETALRNLTQLTPTLSKHLGDMGAVLGDLAVQGTKMMTTGPWREDIGTLMAGNNRIMRNFGESALALMDAFRHISIAAQPMIERFSEWAEKAALGFAENMRIARESGQLTAFFEKAGGALAEFGAIAKQIITGLWDLSQALGPLGMGLFKLIGYVVELVGNLAQANPGFAQFAAAAILGVTALTKLGGAFNSVSTAMTAAGQGFGKVRAALGWFVPGTAYGRLQGLRDRLDAAGVAAQNFTTRATGSAEAGNRVGNATRGFGRAATGLLSSLPLVGVILGGTALAWDALTLSVNEASTAFAEGGQTAIDAWKQVVEQTAGMTAAGVGSMNLLGDNVLRTAGDMSHLEAAQRKAADAGAAWEAALKAANGNISDPDVQAKQAAYAAATGRVADEQKRASDATKSATDRMLEQQNFLLAQGNASVAYEQGLLNLETKQKALAAAVRDYGAGSAQARQAQLDLTSTMLSQVDAAGRQAAANNASKPAAEQAAAKVRAQNREVARLVKLAGASTPQALRNMVGAMTPAQAKAAGLTVETDNLGNSIVRIPGQKPVKLNPSGFTNTKNLANDAKRSIDDVKDKTVTLTMKVVKEVMRSGGMGGVGSALGFGATKQLLGFLGLARGGMVRGPGGPTADQVPILGSNGEFMVNAAATARYLPLLEAINAQTLATGGMVGRGAAPRSPAAPAPTAAAGGAAAQVQVDTTGATDSVNTLSGSVGALTGTLAPLAAQLMGTTVPALEAVQQQAGTDTKMAVDLLGTRFPPLATSAVAAGQRMRQAGAATTRATQLNTVQQTVAHNRLATNHNAATVRIRNQTGLTQRTTGQAWATMSARAGAAVRTITGQHFGALNRGLGGVRASFANTAAWVRDTWSRIRGYTAGPVRYAIGTPLNAMIGAWNKLNREFQLKKHVEPLRIGFASGGEVPGTGTGDKVPAALTPHEVVWDTRAVRNAGGPAAVDAMRLGFRSGRLNQNANPVRDQVTGQDRQRAMRKAPLDDLPKGLAYGGVMPHVASAGKLIERLFGPLPGGIGGVGSRPNASDHPRGLALDFMTLGNRRLGDRIAGYLLAQSQRLGIKYLIWKQMFNEGGGWSRMEDRGSVTANHFDHVHASFLGGGQGGRAFSGAGMPLFDPAALVRGKFADAMKQAKGIGGKFPGTVGSLVQGITVQAITRAQKAGEKRLNDVLMSSVDVGGAGVQRWAPVVLRALKIMGQPASLLPVVLRRMNQESGGNPRAFNGWDSNAAAGTPSVGLMQVIGTTYQSNKHPQFDTGPYIKGTSINPLANILASMRYALGRYGSLAAAYNKPGGYADGGMFMPGQLAYNETRRPEYILNQSQWDAIGQGRAQPGLSNKDLRAFAAAVAQAVAARPSNQVTVTAPPSPGARELVDTLMFTLRHSGKGVHT